MHPLQKQFHDWIIRKQLLHKDDKVLLAVSGGVDSMVMAHLFLASKYSFTIAHCNFGLRGNESDQDEKLVSDWAKQNKIECYVNRFQLDGGSIQLAARNARYEWFDKLCVNNGYHKVATAHHLNDSLETSILNLTRGTGIKGLSGIPPRSKRIIRPLLLTTKEEILEYAKEEKIHWREDGSNSKVDYDRNLLRHQVVPVLKKMNPSLDHTFSNTVERLQLTNQFFQEKVREVQRNYLSKEGNLWKMQTMWVTKETDFLIVSEIVGVFGFNYITSKRICDALDKSGKIFLTEQYELTVDRGCIYIRELKNETDAEVKVNGEGDFGISEKRLSVSIVGRNEVEFDSNKNRVFLDAEKINFPLKIRNWEEGDRLRLLGMRGTKKVSDFLIDHKIPIALKRDVKVMISGESIIWLVGHQISDDFKVSATTKTAIKLEVLIG